MMRRQVHINKGDIMKLSTLACGFILGCVAAAGVTQAFSQDHPGKAPPSPQDMKKMMDEWMKTMNPGEHHKAMEGSIGSWETVTKIWMDPNAPPMETTGIAERKWIMGGRFVQETIKSEMLMPDMAKPGEMQRMPWEGMGLFGYDNYRNLYVGCWVDSMGTQMLTMKGSVSPDGKTWTYYGEMDEPMLGVIGRLVKYQTKIIDNDTHVFSIYDLHAGENYRTVEVTYKRRKFRN
jgi:hypothetical protein